MCLRYEAPVTLNEDSRGTWGWKKFSKNHGRFSSFFKGNRRKKFPINKWVDEEEYRMGCIRLPYLDELYGEDNFYDPGFHIMLEKPKQRWEEKSKLTKVYFENVTATGLDDTFEVDTVVARKMLIPNLPLWKRILGGYRIWNRNY